MTAPTPQDRWEHIRAADERACINAMISIAHDMHEEIIARTNQTVPVKERLCLFVTRMRRSLQMAMIDGGKDEFIKETANWDSADLYKEFMKRLDAQLTRMPMPRKEGHGTDIPPRGRNFLT